MFVPMQDASFEAIRDYERSGDNLEGWRRSSAALMGGNLRFGTAPCGAVAGIIREILPAGEVIHRMVKEYDNVVSNLV
jgi:NAD(P)H-dependent flavin oxidoreductase YrpB (nitropropane dioxygenase family)